MRFKKFLIIPVLIVAYIFLINWLLEYNPSVGTAFQKTGGAGEEIIGVGESVTVSVTRPYFFGLIRLPVYSSVLGSIGGFHSLFFNFIIGLTALFVLIEIIQWRRRKKW